MAFVDYSPCYRGVEVGSSDFDDSSQHKDIEVSKQASMLWVYVSITSFSLRLRCHPPYFIFIQPQEEPSTLTWSLFIAPDRDVHAAGVGAR